MRLIAYVMSSVTTADFSLIVSVVDDKGEPKATIANIPGDDPNMQQRFADIKQAYNMGAKFGDK